MTSNSASAQHMSSPSEMIAESAGRPWSSYLVVPAAWLGHIVSLGIVYSFGVLVPAFQEEWPDATAGDMGFLGSFLTGIFLGSSFIAGLLVLRLGHRCVGVLGGCLAIAGWLAVSAARKPWQAYPGLAVLGTGLNFAWSPGLSLLPPHFPSRKATVSGIAVTGSGVGTLMWSYVNRALVESLGLHTTLFILAGVNSGLIFIAAAGFSPVPAAKNRTNHPTESAETISAVEDGEQVKSQEDVKIMPPATSQSLFKDPIFGVLCIATLFSCLGFFAPFTHAAAFAEELSCNEDTGRGAFMLFGVFSIIGRLLAGPLADRFGALVVWPSGLISCAAALVWLASAPNCNNITYSMGALGLASGPMIAVQAPLLVDLFGMERLTLALGPLNFTNGIASFLSPAIAGFTRELTNSYRFSFVCAGIFESLAASTMLIVILLKYRRDVSKELSTEETSSAETSSTETCEDIVE